MVFSFFRGHPDHITVILGISCVDCNKFYNSFLVSCSSPPLLVLVAVTTSPLVIEVLFLAAESVEVAAGRGVLGGGSTAGNTNIARKHRI